MSPPHVSLAGRRMRKKTVSKAPRCPPRFVMTSTEKDTTQSQSHVFCSPPQTRFKKLRLQTSQFPIMAYIRFLASISLAHFPPDYFLELKKFGIEDVRHFFIDVHLKPE